MKPRMKRYLELIEREGDDELAAEIASDPVLQEKILKMFRSKNDFWFLIGLCDYAATVKLLDALIEHFPTGIRYVGSSEDSDFRYLPHTGDWWNENVQSFETNYSSDYFQGIWMGQMEDGTKILGIAQFVGIMAAPENVARLRAEIKAYQPEED